MLFLIHSLPTFSFLSPMSRAPYKKSRGIGFVTVQPYEGCEMSERIGKAGFYELETNNLDIFYDLEKKKFTTPDCRDHVSRSALQVSA